MKRKKPKDGRILTRSKSPVFRLSSAFISPGSGSFFVLFSLPLDQRGSFRSPVSLAGSSLLSTLKLYKSFTRVSHV